MKDIGSIFPLYDYHILGSGSGKAPIPQSEQSKLYSLCREALFDIARRHKDSCKRVLLPAYTCQTVIEPFLQLGCEVCFYSICKNLRIDSQSILDATNRFNPDIVVAHPYYGMDFDDGETDVLRQIKAKGCSLIVDITQCIFSNVRLYFADYYVGSYRKWFGCPDGAFLEPLNGDFDADICEYADNQDFVSRQTDAMYLRGIYFQTNDEIVKQISIKLNKEAVHSISQEIVPHRMADFSLMMMENEDMDFNQFQRMRNYKTLFQGLRNCSNCTVVCSDLAQITTAPLYFPIYVENRAEMQKRLAQQHIYAPVLWPVCNSAVLINETIAFIFSHLLAIPCDQRYDEKDMDKIINVILA